MKKPKTGEGTRVEEVYERFYFIKKRERFSFTKFTKFFSVLKKLDYATAQLVHPSNSKLFFIVF